MDNGGEKRSSNKVDQGSAESFPASDPPAFMGSTAVAGEPKGHDPAQGRHAHERVSEEKLSIDINTASKEELGRLTALGPARVRVLIERRPFSDWEEVAKLPGFEPGLTDAMQKGGARIG